MPKVLILRAAGTNCDNETAFAFQKAGADTVDIHHINRLLESQKELNNYQILCIPGGFSFGDDIAAGKIFATKIQNQLGGVLTDFCNAGKLILGICNGFQVLLKTGLLMPEDEQGLPATLTWNNSATYTDRWVRLETNSQHCVFLRDIDKMYLPIAHAEGRFVPRSNKELEKLKQKQQIALCYKAVDNPNGSTADIAGICDSTGRILGLMPHPERFIEVYQHPHWTRLYSADDIKKNCFCGDGLKVFQNAVSYFD
ncbi:MAG: phosphoribosylformylglycinamidine synthase I [Planctomycetaceae bacterium]|nr:phosphoribosylformylglycinamidine synthase I [Planctomycetaceae bacterium]